MRQVTTAGAVLHIFSLFSFNTDNRFTVHATKFNPLKASATKMLLASSSFSFMLNFSSTSIEGFISNSSTLLASSSSLTPPSGSTSSLSSSSFTSFRSLSSKLFLEGS